MDNHYDIGIVGGFFFMNFGGSLTFYALYHVLTDMGYSCLAIERPLNAPLPSSAKNLDEIYIENPYPPAFMGTRYASKAAMVKLNELCDVFVVGSDQLFNDYMYHIMGKYVTLDWVWGNKKKIAYAASFGHDYVWGESETHAEMSYFMRRFDAFSVRENSGVKLLKDVFGVDAVWVLDPIFLCDMRHYETLMNRSTADFPERVIGAYILDPTEEKAEILRKCQENLQCEAQIFSEFRPAADYFAPLKGLNVRELRIEDRLRLIRDCEFFVADSFHGVCFAILLRKPFFAIQNAHRGASRLQSILSLLGLEERLITDSAQITQELIMKPIQWDSVHNILRKERDRCFQWLKNALTREKTTRYTDYDVLIRILRQQQKEIDRLKALTGLDWNSEGNLRKYLARLKRNLKNYVILISVKDTPGFALDASLAQAFQALGLKTNLRGKHWNSYVAVIRGGEALFEKISPEAIHMEMEADFGSVSIVSANLKAGNVAEIVINGTDYAVNSRGVNLVVLDRASKCVLDSVCFDTHVKELRCSRNGM